MTINWTNLAQALLTAQSVIFAGFLLYRWKRGVSSNVFLAGFLLCLTAHMGLNFVQEAGILVSGMDLGSGLGFLYGPFIYFYTRSLSSLGGSLIANRWIHFIPAVCVLSMVACGVNFPVEILAGAVVASLAAYLCLALAVIKKQKQVIAQGANPDQRHTLHWLQTIIIGLMVIGGLDLIHSITQTQSNPWSPLFYGLLTVGLLVLVNYMVFKAMQQPSLFLGEPSEINKSAEVHNDAIPGKTVDTVIEQQVNMKRIESFIRTSEDVFDPDLGMGRFSEMVQIPQRKVSEAINTIQGQSFSEYISDWRIQKACGLLENPTYHYKTILEILYEVGFSSKSNFYTAFKKKTGITPVEYRRAAKESNIM